MRRVNEVTHVMLFETVQMRGWYEDVIDSGDVESLSNPWSVGVGRGQGGGGLLSSHLHNCE